MDKPQWRDAWKVERIGVKKEHTSSILFSRSMRGCSKGSGKGLGLLGRGLNLFRNAKAPSISAPAGIFSGHGYSLSELFFPFVIFADMVSCCCCRSHLFFSVATEVLNGNSWPVTAQLLELWSKHCSLTPPPPPFWHRNASKSADKKPQKETSTTPINPIPICTILKHLKKLRNSENSQCVQPHDLKIVLRYSYYSKQGRRRRRWAGGESGRTERKRKSERTFRCKRLMNQKERKKKENRQEKQQNRMQEKALRWRSKGQRRNAAEEEEIVEEEEDGRREKLPGDRMRCERWW